MLSGLLSLEEDHTSRLVEAARERVAGPVYVAEPDLRLNVYPRSPSLASAR